jgi:hypothetical protein
MLAMSPQARLEECLAAGPGLAGTAQRTTREAAVVVAARSWWKQVQTPHRAVLTRPVVVAVAAVLIEAQSAGTPVPEWRKTAAEER